MLHESMQNKMDKKPLQSHVSLIQIYSYVKYNITQGN